MRFLSRSEITPRFEGRSVAIVGSGPSAAANPPGLVDSHDVVIRVNNYKLTGGTGSRTDVHYSFYGKSVKKTADALRRDGVSLCMCKCPNSQPIESEWHVAQRKMAGIDFHYIYRNRADWWFCDTWLPTDAEFLAGFELLDRHIPTTGFAAILDVLALAPGSVYLTGFDFFASGIHNVDEPWRVKNHGDPIGHRPDLERAWLTAHWGDFPLSGDGALMAAMKEAA